MSAARDRRRAARRAGCAARLPRRARSPRRRAPPAAPGVVAPPGFRRRRGGRRRGSRTALQACDAGPEAAELRLEALVPAIEVVHAVDARLAARGEAGED